MIVFRSYNEFVNCLGCSARASFTGKSSADRVCAIAPGHASVNKEVVLPSHAWFREAFGRWPGGAFILCDILQDILSERLIRRRRQNH